MLSQLAFDMVNILKDKACYAATLALAAILLFPLLSPYDPAYGGPFDIREYRRAYQTQLQNEAAGLNNADPEDLRSIQREMLEAYRSIIDGPSLGYSLEQLEAMVRLEELTIKMIRGGYHSSSTTTMEEARRAWLD